MTVIGVPYHLDEYLPGLDLTPEPTELITPELPAGETWPRLAVPYAAVARAMTRSRFGADHPVVVASGDCLTALGTSPACRPSAPTRRSSGSTPTATCRRPRRAPPATWPAWRCACSPGTARS